MHLSIVTTNPIIAEVLAEEFREVHDVSVDVIDIVQVESGEFIPAPNDIVIVTEAALERWCRWRGGQNRPSGATEVIGALGQRWLVNESPEEHGFAGCVDFKWPARDVVRELNSIRLGRVSSPESIDGCPSMSSTGPLCHDEIDRRIAAYITMGMSDRDIGAKVFLSPQTVRNRVSRMLERSQVQNRTQLAMACVVNPDLMQVHCNDETSTPRSASMVR